MFSYLHINIRKYEQSSEKCEQIKIETTTNTKLCKKKIILNKIHNNNYNNFLNFTFTLRVYLVLIN